MSYKEKFTDKRVLITGASKGLGNVCASFFEQAGAQVVTTGRTEERLEELHKGFAEPSKHKFIVADLSKLEEIESTVKQGHEFLGGYDIVIHSLGGGYGFKDPLLTWDQFNLLHKVNCGAAAEINRLVAPEMIERRKGNLIHICSIASHEATGSVGYNTVKAALSGYVRSLGRELAQHQLVVTGILPGAFFAPGNAFRRLEENDPAIVENFIEKRLPRNKVGEADELIPLISLLASDEASMMTGSCVPIDAGEGISFIM